MAGRGTLGVDRRAPVGFSEIALRFELDARGASEEQLATLLKPSERYCVVLQTLRSTPITRADRRYSGRTGGRDSRVRRRCDSV